MADTASSTAVPTATPLDERTITAVSEALNRAANDILDAAGIDSADRAADAINLLVNTALAYMNGQATDVAQAIACSYEIQDGASGPLEWVTW